MTTPSTNVPAQDRRRVVPLLVSKFVSLSSTTRMSGGSDSKPLGRWTVAELKAELTKRDLPLSVSHSVNRTVSLLIMGAIYILSGAESRAGYTLARSHGRRCCI